ncbi:MAG: response regulator transcription factor, partial [Hominilimicola sp.]
MDRIYCVEDDEGIRDLITYAVKSAGFEAEGFESARSFEERLKISVPSMVLLDIMLPDKDGIEILKGIRQNEVTKNLPVIMITAKGTESDKVKGFEYGADDYVTKPFGVMELISRIKAVLRRSTAVNTDIIDYKGITMDNQSRSVKVDGEDITITFKEFELLKYLLT